MIMEGLVIYIIKRNYIINKYHKIKIFYFNKYHLKNFIIYIKLIYHHNNTRRKKAYNFISLKEEDKIIRKHDIN